MIFPCAEAKTLFAVLLRGGSGDSEGGLWELSWKQQIWWENQLPKDLLMLLVGVDERRALVVHVYVHKVTLSTLNVCIWGLMVVCYSGFLEWECWSRFSFCLLISLFLYLMTSDVWITQWALGQCLLWSDMLDTHGYHKKNSALG